jgi:hypothetical protein
MRNAEKKMVRFQDEVNKIQALHGAEIHGHLWHYFSISGNTIPLLWEDKPLPQEIKRKVIMAAFYTIGY